MALARDPFTLAVKLVKEFDADTTAPAGTVVTVPLAKVVVITDCVVVVAVVVGVAVVLPGVVPAHFLLMEVSPVEASEEPVPQALLKHWLMVLTNVWFVQRACQSRVCTPVSQ